MRLTHILDLKWENGGSLIRENKKVDTLIIDLWSYFVVQLTIFQINIALNSVQKVINKSKLKDIVQ